MKEENNESYFIRYDELTGISFRFPKTIFNCLSLSSFDEDYKFEMDWRLWVKEQEDINFNFI